MSTIKYKTYQKALSYIAYWILTNKKKVTECEVYSYNNKGYKLATVKKKILEGKGKISTEKAKQKAESEYEKYKKIYVQEPKRKHVDIISGFLKIVVK